MLLALLLTGLLSAQTPAVTHEAAADLARNGQHEEALAAFRRLASANPRDHAARLWIARLHVWMGHTRQAIPVYRSVLLEDASNVEAMVGLGTALASDGQTDEAIDILEEAERLDPTNAEILAQLGRAHRRAGHTSRSLGYLQRAVEIAPTTDNRLSLERTRLIHEHRVEFGGFVEDFSRFYPDAHSASVGVNVRLNDRWRVSGRGQSQRKFSQTEQRGGVGAELRWDADTTFLAHAVVGPGNDVLPAGDFGVEVDHARGSAAWTLGLRYFDFAGATAAVLSPRVDWWVTDRISAGVSYAAVFTDFDVVASTTTGHTLGLRGSYLFRPRVSFDLGYTRGVTSFETFSPDELGEFRANTVSAGVRFELPSLTWLLGKYEYQWRPNNLQVGRFSLGFAQRF